MTFLLIIVGVALVLAILAREAALHLFASSAARQMRQRGQAREARALLERAVAAPTLLGDRARQNTRFHLAWHLMEAGGYEQAAEQCRVILRRQQPPGVEARIRQRLADCLEA